jgi:Ca2+-binding RTX toxin-like protein
VINGNTTGETYRIYTREAFDAVPGNTLGGINAATEIIITRNGTNFTSIIAELRDIEEIRINGVDPTGAAGGAGAGDTFLAIGDFSATSLRLNTITIDGQAGNDTVDISALASAHRIVFRSNGGSDTVVGTLRAQDVIEVPAGSNLADYDLTENPDGSKTLASATHSVTFTGDVPTLEVAAPPPAPSTDLVGTTRADQLTGTASGDTILGRAGNDKVWGAGGDDRFMTEKGDGTDTYYGDDGSDTLDMSAITAKITADLGSGSSGKGRVSSSHTGSDTLWGVENIVTGSGNDVIIASTAVNVMDAGDGSNTFRFLSAAHADGDTILGFQAGDKIDLSRIDTDGSAKGDQKFTLVSGAFTGGTGELLVTYDAEGDQTLVLGNLAGGANHVDFTLAIQGQHDLDASDFKL